MIALGKCVVYVRVYAMLMDGMTSLMYVVCFRTG